jgi:hypothetical protein
MCEINLQGSLPDGTVIDKHHHLSIQIGDAEVSVTYRNMYNHFVCCVGNAAA